MNKVIKIPELHQRFINDSVSRLKEDTRILGVAAGGSILLGTMDEFSDLDLVVVVDPKHYTEVLTERKPIAKSIGSLVESFTGEHVGEPRLLICLYGPPLLHVDFKFISFEDIEDKVENPIILWERDKCLSEVVYKSDAYFPSPNSEWIEERFWIWIHYAATKLGRGELFEVLDFLSFLRNTVLGPLILKRNKARPQGVRKIEQFCSESELDKLKSTIAEYSKNSCISAIFNTIYLYKELQTHNGNQDAETYSISYLNEVVSKINKSQ